MKIGIYAGFGIKRTRPGFGWLSGLGSEDWQTGRFGGLGFDENKILLHKHLN